MYRLEVFAFLCFTFRLTATHHGQNPPFSPCESLAFAFTSSCAEDKPSVSRLSLRFLAIFWNNVDISWGTNDVCYSNSRRVERHRYGDSLLTRYTGWPFTFTSLRKPFATAPPAGAGVQRDFCCFDHVPQHVTFHMRWRLKSCLSSFLWCFECSHIGWTLLSSTYVTASATVLFYFAY